ncbi:hypothetical protein GCM10023142_14680 [Anaerocolumna aminovalerica]|jgi:hypothetical protein
MAAFGIEGVDYYIITSKIREDKHDEKIFIFNMSIIVYAGINKLWEKIR